MAQVLSPGALPPEPPAAKPAPAEWKENLNVKYECKDCRTFPPKIFEDPTSGDVMCDECGLVMSERNIDMSSEWRTFSNDDQGNDDPSRVGDGPNSLLHGDQLDTQIKFEGGIRNKDLARAQKTATADKTNRTLMQAYKEIGAYGDAWQLPSAVTDSAKHVFKQVEESKAFKGKPNDVVLAGCLFAACRDAGLGRTFREVMDLTGVPKKDLGRFVKSLQTFIQRKKVEENKDAANHGKQAQTWSDSGSLNMNACTASQGDANTQVDHAQDVRRFCNKMSIEQRVTNATEALANRVTKDQTLEGRSPLSIVAAIMFMGFQLMNQPKTAKEIGGVVGVSDSTIRQSYKLLYGAKDRLVDDELLRRGADPEKLSKPA